MSKNYRKKNNPADDYKKDMTNDNKPLTFKKKRTSKITKTTRAPKNKAIRTTQYDASKHAIVDEIVEQLASKYPIFKSGWELADSPLRLFVKDALTSITHSNTKPEEKKKSTAISPPKQSQLDKTREFNAVLDNVILD